MHNYENFVELLFNKKPTMNSSIEIICYPNPNKFM